MRSKQKLVLFLLFLMFIATAGMFYYQNFHLKANDMKGKVYVVIAKKDIAEGDKLVEGENYTYMMLDEQFAFENYIVVDNQGKYKELIEGKKAKFPIFKTGVILKNMIENEENQDEKETFKLFVKTKDKMDVEKGDRINVYVRLKDTKANGLTGHEIYSLFEDKVIQNVVMKKNSKGEDTSTIEYIELDVDEKDAVYYQLATFIKGAEILVLEYNNFYEQIQTNVPHFSQSEGFKKAKEQFPGSEMGKFMTGIKKS